MSKQELYKVIEGERQRLLELNDFIHSNPELGNQEFEASKRIKKLLSDNNFDIEENIIGLETAFIGTWKNHDSEEAPVIGLLCEYDALEGIGHACGHNLQSPSICGSAIALSKVLEESEHPVTLKVIGTPAEETTSAKIPMSKEGIFDNLDIAIMMHGGDRTTVDGKSLALNLVEFEFTGKAAHAAIAPEQGISALDALLMTFNGLEYLREHIRSDVRIHGIIKHGGVSANVVPDYALGQFYIRANDRPHLDEAVERVYNVARGAALATGAKLNIKVVKSLDNKINVQTLNDLLLKNAEEVGIPNITPPREKTGSTDFSLVTYRIPGACLRVSFVPFGTSSHTELMTSMGNKKEGQEAIIYGAKAISGACYEIVTSPELLKQIKDDFNRNKFANN
ncbi:M20 family peptidase [Romboutsia weinsteinii]|uniref:Peptidase M20 domain-containing protein 2 n=1 Tax=Romboutsia weinsteinii TaxID=2020949 RepID=A0A371IXK5_9FIRM|nr:M20 family metallopeptidase [Romboutsia weinsteinii]RDY25212.1 M20 family peptidase [Romboutsia weinsteinii]